MEAPPTEKASDPGEGHRHQVNLPRVRGPALPATNADQIPRASARGADDKGEGASNRKGHPVGWLFLNKIPGISPSVNIRAPFALQASPHTEKPRIRARGIDIRLIYREYGGRHCLRRMRTGSRAPARGARAMKGEAPPTEKDTRWVSFSVECRLLKRYF